MNRESLKRHREVLYKIHDYDPKLNTKNVHHIIERSIGGTNAFENLALLDKDFHIWIHRLLEKMDKRGGKLTEKEKEIIKYLMENDKL